MNTPYPKILHAVLSSFNSLSTDEISHVLQCFSYKTYSKGTILVNKGEINDNLYFIEVGILREFSYIDQDQDQDQDQDLSVTHWLIAENSFFYNANGFFEQVPSTVTLEAMEKVKVWVIEKEKLEELYNKIPKIERIVRILTEKYMKKYENFIWMLRQTTEIRWEWYCTNHKNLANRVPLKYVASYLNMTPETLSRVRKKGCIA